MTALNPVLIVRILLVVFAGVITYKRTKSIQKTLIAVIATFVIVWGISFIADQFME